MIVFQISFFYEEKDGCFGLYVLGQLDFFSESMAPVIYRLISLFLQHEKEIVFVNCDV